MGRKLYERSVIVIYPLCECGHEERHHDNEAGKCDKIGCDCQTFWIDYDALLTHLAALTAEREALLQALLQAQDERGRLRDALTDMLYIFDRGLPDNSLGRMRCDQARDALNPPNSNQPEQGEPK